MFLSIVHSKILFYCFQYILIFSNIVLAEEVSHPLLPQIIITLCLIIYTQLFFKNKKWIKFQE